MPFKKAVLLTLLMGLLAGCDKPKESTTVNEPVLLEKSPAPQLEGSKPLKQTQPAYPKLAFDRKIEGQVVVLFDINAQGRVENVRFLSATPPDTFEREVRTALKKWRYTPVVVKDKKMTIIFKMDDKAQPQE